MSLPVIVQAIQSNGGMDNIWPGVLAPHDRQDRRCRPEIRKSQDDTTKEGCQPAVG
jgi:hypothetical protein